LAKCERGVQKGVIDAHRDMIIWKKMFLVALDKLRISVDVLHWDVNADRIRGNKRKLFGK
jgi:hypothetical protein